MSRKSALDGDVTKLPKWAQRRLYCLERDVGYYKDKLSEALGGEGDPKRGLPIIIDPYADVARRLPRGSTIIFRLEESDDSMAAGIEVRHAETTLNGKKVPTVEVRACGSSDALVFEPYSGNMGVLRTRRRF